MCIIVRGTKTVLFYFFRTGTGVFDIGLWEICSSSSFLHHWSRNDGIYWVWCLAPDYSNYWVCYIRVIHKVLQLGRENSQFWHNRPLNTQVRMKFLQSEITRTQTSFWTEFHLVFLFFLTHPTYIFTAPTYTTIIVTLEPCALKCQVSVFHTEI
jgi:hypothetical protein